MLLEKAVGKSEWKIGFWCVWGRGGGVYVRCHTPK